MSETRTFSVADYLLARLAELGVRHLFGVPGDYNLAFLDHVVRHPLIGWVGNANELNAAYAADGYARVNGLGALVTTFGVGELSAINGIAGSYAEYVPVIHIVGTPPTSAQRNGALMHHTLGEGEFGHFARAYAEVTVARAELTVENAADEIDRVLIAALRERRPAYLAIPVDVAVEPLRAPSAPLHVSEPRFSSAALDAFVARARTMLAQAGSAVVLGDFLADRFAVQPQLRRLVERGGFPHATLAMGKGLFDETALDFIGTFAGRGSAPEVRERIVRADVVIAAGVRFYDGITAGFTQDILDERLIDIQPFATRIGGERFAPLPMRRALEGLIGVVEELGRSWRQTPVRVRQRAPRSDDEALSQAELWSQIGSFLRTDDIVVADLGTAYFGAALMPLPHGARLIGQPLWASIGYALPAAYGAQLAAPERRVVLLIGDGAALVTAQELGSMLRDGVAPVIVLLNNNGYTIERIVHRPAEPYHDIPRWDWSLLTATMGPGMRSLTLRADSPATLASALATAANADCLVLVEAQLPMLDAPALLTVLADAVRGDNAA
ncbi:MAG TPA: thiamine pyrophosphate-binding protein [Candidatus Acidoferrum sp.]|nr:thiamine pyrophosphate-binding protein [Candidatus Acidoferrum sp.]